jgi:hypothetical protein
VPCSPDFCNKKQENSKKSHVSNMLQIAAKTLIYPSTTMKSMGTCTPLRGVKGVLNRVPLKGVLKIIPVRKAIDNEGEQKQARTLQSVNQDNPVR